MILKSKVKIAALALTSLLYVTFSGCGKTMTYSDHLDEEDNQIENFIKDHHITTVGTMPADSGDWVDSNGNEIYYLYASGKAEGLYYHQVKLGEGTTAPQKNWTAYVRYVGYTLTGTMRYNCTAQYSPDPQSFKITSDASGSTFGEGFQQAVKNLRVGGKCKVIIPFKIGNESNVTITGSTLSDAEEYRPMYYEIELVGLE